MAISLFRVDDRLVHGQVAEVWVRHINANRIIVVDDFTAKDTFLSSIMVMMSPSSCRVEVHTVEDAVRPIQRYDRDPAIRCIVLFSSPLVAQELRRHGVEMGSLCIGGMQRRPERKAFYKNQNATGEEMAAMAGMVADGVKIYHKIVPSEAQVDLTNYIR